ncbi:MAG TPA: acetyl-CoA decarbonylase/synthase complex subunit gamma [Candidatus Aerophobetes bacterium]|uniref:Acetyl-CoA decarbonylase/synthase complex subunit gamma n=1 Tax=Aerophobetes bacterium TaxID=2030807 RepID=A0A7V0MYA9_UNCAE|nr:acetyl-CoA decarbonylase/synthase complex subunit gamma [Candidatus Aerophobetes bacterium]
MALTGLQIYKLLPKTNCGDCNFPTCMAFAMQVAAKKVSIDKCPHISEEARSQLAEASAPPMRLVSIGTDHNKLEIGQETVLFRHKEKFYHPTGIAILLEDNLSDEEVNDKLESISKLKFTRVGEEIGIDLVALKHTSADAERYTQLAGKTMEKTGLSLILICQDTAVLESTLDSIADKRPLIYAANKDNFRQMASLAKKYNTPLSVYAESLEELADLTQEIKKLGVDDLVLDPGARGTKEALSELTKLRRLAVEKVFRPLGYPTIIFTSEDDPYQEVAQAATYVCKYAGIVVMKADTPWQILPLLTVRQNIYTDPQVPNAVEAKLYEIGSVTPESPIIVTTNFSLTYFTVESEVENSKIPTYISVVDTEGLGVLNAYAGDKWSPERIAKTLEQQKVKEKVNHNTIIIPGLVAVFRAELIDEFGWNVLVGPEEAARIPGFLKNEWKPGGK